MKVTGFLVLCTLGLAVSQRPGFAGRIPYGYPDINEDVQTTAPAAAPVQPIEDRFAVDNIVMSQPLPTQPPTTTTTQQLPIEAKGDAALVRRLSQLPVDKQPFWFINWKALEQHRSQPSSYFVPGNQFIDYVSSGNQNRWIYE